MPNLAIEFLRQYLSRTSRLISAPLFWAIAVISQVKSDAISNTRSVRSPYSYNVEEIRSHEYDGVRWLLNVAWNSKLCRLVVGTHKRNVVLQLVVEDYRVSSAVQLNVMAVNQRHACHSWHVQLLSVARLPIWKKKTKIKQLIRTVRNYDPGSNVTGI